MVLGAPGPLIISGRSCLEVALPQSTAFRILLGNLSDGERAKMEDLELELYGRRASDGRSALRAILACKMGARLEDVARALDWKEFESFSAGLLRSRGFDVVENVMLRRPRAQVDLLAKSDLVSLAVDCKRWKRAMGPSSLFRCVQAQRRRARLIRQAEPGVSPIASVILLLSEEDVKLVGGGAAVPVRTLSSFLDDVRGLELEFD